MSAMVLDRSLAAAVGALLEYPGADYFANAVAAHDALAEVSSAAADCLSSFLEEMDGKSCHELEEIYTRTFDFSPLCNAYVSVHLFGDESFKRSQLMTGLVESYHRAGFDPGVELPDHLAVVLRFAPQWTDAEWHDMVTCCLRPAVKKMIEPLARSASPYRHALQALVHLFDAEFPQETSHV